MLAVSRSSDRLRENECKEPNWPRSPHLELRNPNLGSKVLSWFKRVMYLHVQQRPDEGDSTLIKPGLEGKSSLRKESVRKGPSWQAYNEHRGNGRTQPVWDGMV
jgi:hypothetical protein